MPYSLTLSFVRSGVVTWIESPSVTLVTVPATVRMVAWLTGILINIVHDAIKSREMNVLKHNVFNRIVSGNSSFAVFCNEDKGKCSECQIGRKDPVCAAPDTPKLMQ